MINVFLKSPYQNWDRNKQSVVSTLKVKDKLPALKGQAQNLAGTIMY